MRPIRFRFSPEKARAAVHWMVAQKQGVDLHTLLKACYFADKDHLNKHDRPVFGATYKAMRFGPVPLEIYEMAKGDPIWLADLGTPSYPWALRDGFRLHLVSNEEPSLSSLSETDSAAIKASFQLSTSMSFNMRTLATHGPDWQAANLGIIRYEDMLDDAPDKVDRISYLRDAAPFLRL